jgi:hypothetical protein
MRKIFRGINAGTNRDALKISGLCLLLAAGTQAFMGCDATSSSTTFAVGVDGNTGSDGSGGTGGTSGTTGGSGISAGAGVDSTQFSVSVVPIQNVTSIIHESDVNEFAYTSPCTISTADIENVVTGTNNEEIVIQCIVEEAELDLYDHGVSLNFNVPPGVCNYLDFAAPYYYSYPTGTGPGWVEYETNSGAPPTNVSNSYQGTPYCPYDFTNSINIFGANGPNCCLGYYDQQIDSAGSPPSLTSNLAWGAKPGSCLEGPAMQTQTIDASNGFPEDTIYNGVMESGMNQVYTVASPISRQANSVIYVANYFPNSTTQADWPAAFYPPNGQTPPTSGTAYDNYVNLDQQAQPFFQFDCLDSAYELRARIQVQVRGWDLQSNVGVATSYSNTGGIDPISGIPYHKYDNWLDITSFTGDQEPMGSGFSGTWQTGYPEYYQ